MVLHGGKGLRDISAFFLLSRWQLQLIQVVSGDYKCEGFIVSLHHSSSQKNAALLKKRKKSQTRGLFNLLRETSLNVSLGQNIFARAPGPLKKGDFLVLAPFW